MCLGSNRSESERHSISDRTNNSHYYYQSSMYACLPPELNSLLRDAHNNAAYFLNGYFRALLYSIIAAALLYFFNSHRHDLLFHYEVCFEKQKTGSSVNHYLLTYYSNQHLQKFGN